MRKFEFVLNHGVGNILRTTATIEAETTFAAFDKFCFEMRCIGYPMRQERANVKDGILYAVWSAGCDISGQRIYISEQIGYAQ